MLHCYAFCVDEGSGLTPTPGMHTQGSPSHQVCVCTLIAIVVSGKQDPRQFRSSKAKWSKLVVTAKTSLFCIPRGWLNARVAS